MISSKEEENEIQHRNQILNTKEKYLRHGLSYHSHIGK